MTRPTMTTFVSSTSPLQTCLKMTFSKILFICALTIGMLSDGTAHADGFAITAGGGGYGVLTKEESTRTDQRPVALQANLGLGWAWKEVAVMAIAGGGLGPTYAGLSALG